VKYAESRRVTFTHPGDGAAQPSDLPVMPRRWAWHIATKQLMVIMPQVDYSQAQCVGRDDLFVGDQLHVRRLEKARELCDQCPVKKSCHAWGLAHEEFGVWAGTTPEQRRAERRALGLRLVEPSHAHVYGLNDDPMRRNIPEQCKNGHFLKPRYDSAITKGSSFTPYRLDYRVDCTQCYYERSESPEARVAMSEKGKRGAQAIHERGTRNTTRINKWGAA